MSFYDFYKLLDCALKQMPETNQKECLWISNRETESGGVGEQSRGDWTTASSCQGNTTNSVGWHLCGSHHFSQAGLCLLGSNQLLQRTL